jgi:hypothetical protein
MQSQSIILLALSLISFGAMAQSDARPTWSLKTSVPSGELVGEWELSELSATASDSEVATAAAAAQVGVAAGSTFQLKVKLVDPTGAITDVTGSPKLIYRPKGCMSVNASGVATVLQTAAAPWTCNAGDPVPLTIIYGDQAIGAGAVNMYVFKIN